MENPYYEDEELLEIIRKDQKRGIKILVKQYQGYLTKHAMRTYDLPVQVVEEMVSNVFMKAINNIGQFYPKGKKALRNWLFKILQNECIDFMRKEKEFKDEFKILKYDESELEEDDGVANGQTYSVLKEIFERSNRDVKEDVNKTALYDVLNNFSPEEQKYIWNYFSAIPYEEIATMDNCKVDAVKQRMSRVIRKLTTRLSEKFNLNKKELHEKIKKEHKKDTTGRYSGR